MFITVAAGLTGCATFPTLDATITDADRAAPFPALVDIAPLVAQSQAAPQPDISMSARIAALQARAARLRRLDI